MSIRIFELPPKAGEVLNSTKIPTEDPNDVTNATRMIAASDLTPFTYAATDEDSPLSLGLLYTTETAVVGRSINNVAFSLKNAPTGNTIEIDILKETGINTNVFATILSTRPTIMINEFTSTTSTPVPILSTNIWESGRRLQIVLTINDANFAATGLKVTIKS